MDPYTFFLVFGLIVIFVGLEFFRDWRYWKRIDRLLNRIQSQNYPEFRYYEDQYKPDLKNANDQIQKAIKKEEKKREQPQTIKNPENDEVINLDDLEEDWDKSEFDEEESEK